MMDYEKKYKEALERARAKYAMKDQPIHQDLVDLFPELKESEDERIRKALIELVKQSRDILYPSNQKSMLDWLEKQGEQKNTAEEVLIKAGLKPYKDGDQWCVLLGDNIQEGICGFGNTIEDALYAFLKDLIASQSEQKLNGTFVNVDDVREDFVQEVYRVLDADSTNDRANQIIDAFDNLPTVAIEKQGEQKPTDKIEPKFKVGDIITNGEIIGKVDENENNKYHGWFGYNKDLSVHYADIPDVENWHKWTIQDAKDGDVLADGNLPFIFKKIDTNKYSYAYCGISVDDGFKIESDGESGEWTWMRDIKPTTKEQRNLLFQKMHEAGYEWDAEKKELKKIEHTTWSGEDETGLTNTIIMLKEGASLHFNKKDITKAVNWLKSLKDRYTWKPSEEQMKALKHASNDCSIAFADMKILSTLYEQLKAIKL